MPHMEASVPVVYSEEHRGLRRVRPAIAALDLDIQAQLARFRTSYATYGSFSLCCIDRKTERSASRQTSDCSSRFGYPGSARKDLDLLCHTWKLQFLLYTLRNTEVCVASDQRLQLSIWISRLSSQGSGPPMPHMEASVSVV